MSRVGARRARRLALVRVRGRRLGQPARRRRHRPLRLRLRPRLRRARCEAFYAVSGPPPVLPRWALGNWWSRYHRYSADSYLELHGPLRGRGPAVLGRACSTWTGTASTSVPEQYGSRLDRLQLGAGRCSPTRRASSPSCTAAACGSRSTSTPPTACAPSRTPTAAMAEALGRDPDAGEPIAFDVTDRAFLDAYLEVLHHPLEDQGVDFWWLDWQQGPHSRIAGHRPAVDAQPLPLPRLRPRRPAAADVLALRRARAATATRSASPATRSSRGRRWTSSPSSPRPRRTSATAGGATTSAATSSASRDDELATRWVQLGVFSPILRLHSVEQPVPRQGAVAVPARGARRDDRRAALPPPARALPAHDEPPRRRRGRAAGAADVPPRARRAARLRRCRTSSRSAPSCSSRRSPRRATR